MEMSDLRLSRRRAITLAAATGTAAVAAQAVPAAATPAAAGPTVVVPAHGGAPGLLAAPVGAWGDQGDGSYVNQIVPADLSDLDAIRVGADYYAISSTIQYAPGMAVLHSKDLVNWAIIGHAAADLARIGPELNWDRMNRHGDGVWAGAIRHHDGRFWVYFNTPDEGFFVTSATNPAGPWEPLTAMWRVTGWNDVCPFWDDDGQGYLATTHFADNYKIHLFRLGADNRSLVMSSDTVIHQSNRSEASKLYKIDGRYYHFYSEVRGGARMVMMNRSANLYGPYETRQLNRTSARGDREPNQGGIVQAPSGAWYFLTHHGTGGYWEGRSMSLLPVTWRDGWPIIGQVGADGIGTMVWDGRVPAGGNGAPLDALSGVVTNDDFSRTALRPAWEWNYQPRADRWSLTERRGFLRLRSFTPLGGNNLTRVGNVLTQRAFKSTASTVTVRLEIGGLADGQHAGLSHFAATYASLGVSRAGGVTTLTLNVNGTLSYGPQLAVAAIWLRSTWGLDGVSRFSYSTDGRAFTTFGSTYQLTWGGYRGDRVGIFTYHTSGSGGHVDVDTFQYTTTPARSYTVANVATGKLADVSGGSSAEGAAVVQWPDKGGTNQHWQFQSTGDGYHTIANMRSGKLLAVGSADDGGPVVQTTGISGNGTAGQQWLLRPVDGGTAFVVVNRQTGRVLDVAGSSTADGAALVQSPDRAVAGQRWRLRLIP